MGFLAQFKSQHLGEFYCRESRMDPLLGHVLRTYIVPQEKGIEY